MEIDKIGRLCYLLDIEKPINHKRMRIDKTVIFTFVFSFLVIVLSIVVGYINL